MIIFAVKYDIDFMLINLDSSRYGCHGFSYHGVYVEWSDENVQLFHEMYVVKIL